MRRKPNTLEDAYSRIENETMPIPESGCLIWLGTVSNGYGYISIGRKAIGVHRLVYERKYGPIPEKMVICHKCDNPPCCNINHLFLGTYGDNVRDSIKKGRKIGDNAKHYSKLSLTNDLKSL